MRPSLEALTAEFRALAARKLSANEPFDEDVLNWWRADGVDVAAVLLDLDLAA
jgi:hypothetical protein